MKRKNVPAIALCLLLALAAACYAGAGATAAREGGTSKGKMPGKVVLGSIAEQYGPVAFDHAKHVGMASGCAECHHQHGEAQVASCGECHAVDAASFKKNVKLARVRPCGECHPATYHKEAPERPTLKAAYHRACIKCHREVGSVGKDPKGCTETCHESTAQAKAR